MGAQRSGNAKEQTEPASPSVPPLWLTVPARPGQLAGLRSALRQWMAQAGVDEDDATSVQVAVGEAASNAVEHAYQGGETGLVRLTAWLESDGVLTVQVIDDGRWRPDGEHTTDRGRGFSLMRATMDDVDIDHRPDGTTIHMRLTLGAATD